MFDFLAPYKLAIEISVFTALAAAGVWGCHSFLAHEQDIGYQRAVAEYTAKLEAQKDAAHKTEIDLRKQLEDAQNAAIQRNQALAAASAAATASSNSLRDSLGHIRDGVPGATAASLAQSVVALTTILGDCAARYTDMAGKADRHASDAKLLFDSWPKVK